MKKHSRHGAIGVVLVKRLGERALFDDVADAVYVAKG